MYPYVSARSPGQREAVTAAAAEFAAAAAQSDAALARHVLHLLLGRVADESAAVRLTALRGLRRLATSNAAAAAADFGTTKEGGQENAQLLGALAAALDDSDDAVRLAAFGALRRALSRADAAAVTPLLPSVCMRCRAAIDNDAKGVPLRSAGFSLFAELARFAAVVPSLRLPFAEHAHALLPASLTHLNHDEPNLSAAAAAALAALRPALGLDSESNGGDDAAAACAQLARAHPDRLASCLSGCAERLSSADACVRRGAAALAKELLALVKADDAPAARTHTCALLASALKDGEPSVRAMAARALGSC